MRLRRRGGSDATPATQTQHATNPIRLAFAFSNMPLLKRSHLRWTMRGAERQPSMPGLSSTGASNASASDPDLGATLSASRQAPEVRPAPPSAGSHSVWRPTELSKNRRASVQARLRAPTRRRARVWRDRKQVGCIGRTRSVFGGAMVRPLPKTQMTDQPERHRKV